MRRVAHDSQCSSGLCALPHPTSCRGVQTNSHVHLCSERDWHSLGSYPSQSSKQIHVRAAAEN